VGDPRFIKHPFIGTARQSAHRHWLATQPCGPPELRGGSDRGLPPQYWPYT
jgi:hypothetical protein